MNSPSEPIIVALATPPGISALAVIRMSGPEAIGLAEQVFSGRSPAKMKGFSAAFGEIKEGDQIIDEVVLTVYRTPKSYTGEDMVEISSHGSPYVVQRILQLLISKGARQAGPGEFTRRAFLNGKLDLSQAEAVADLIHSEAAFAHRSAIYQLKGGLSAQLSTLRIRLIDFAALIELELDFSEEDVEFANRKQLLALVAELLEVIHKLTDSFALGNAMKKGVSVAIVGKPNTGKSTLLNALLQEEKAIVSDIPGTTRDVIEDQLTIGGLQFRIMDTAGLRHSTDAIESIGIERSRDRMAKADLVLFLVDLSIDQAQQIEQELDELSDIRHKLILVGNKTDCLTSENLTDWKKAFPEAIFITALAQQGIELLKDTLLKRSMDERMLSGELPVTNARHFEHLLRTEQALSRVEHGLDNPMSAELLAQDLRIALYELGLITGEVSNEEVLGSIFSRFCIGK
jgi:tRNA modification GTPase